LANSSTWFKLKSDCLARKLRHSNDVGAGPPYHPEVMEPTRPSSTGHFKTSFRPSHSPGFQQRSAGTSGGTAYLRRSSISGFGRNVSSDTINLTTKRMIGKPLLRISRRTAHGSRNLPRARNSEYHSIRSVESRDYRLSKTPSTSLPQFITIRSSKEMGNFNSMFSGRHLEE
jgi:hypothetical protein